MPSTNICEAGGAPEAARERQVTVLAHCMLNPSTRVKGLRPVLFQPDGPLIQLPCPEALYLGLDRWASTRNQLDVPEFRRFCRSLILHYADLLEMLARQGTRIRIVGLAGSPSCGVDTTSLGYAGGRVRQCEHEHVPGRGIFMEELLAELERRGISFEAEEAGQERASESEFGSMPGIAPFQREEMDRFD
jgi:predicted secreted protein